MPLSSILGGLPFTINVSRVGLVIAYSTMPSLAGHCLDGTNGTNMLGVQPIGTNGIYAGNKLTVGTQYILQFSGAYVCM